MNCLWLIRVDWLLFTATSSTTAELRYKMMAQSQEGFLSDEVGQMVSLWMSLDQVCWHFELLYINYNNLHEQI